MTVTLTPEQEKFILEQIKSGHYRSAEDVVTQSLGMLRDHEECFHSNSAELREKIAVGIQQIERGEVSDGKKVFDELLERNRQRKQPKSSDFLPLDERRN